MGIEKDDTGLLNNAINEENKGGSTLFYWNKKEAISLLDDKQGTMPEIESFEGGFMSSIRDDDSAVKPKFESQIQTRQFKRWFGESKIVNPDGTPKILYHQTNAEFTVFDTQRQGPGYYDSEMPSGIYMKETPDTIKLGTDYGNSRQMPLYVRMECRSICLTENRLPSHGSWRLPAPPPYLKARCLQA